MKIAVTATGPSLDDHVEPRFGRCPYFLIIETDTGEVEAMENPNVALGGGAGIQSAQMMAQREVETVLTGNCGHRLCMITPRAPRRSEMPPGARREEDGDPRGRRRRATPRPAHLACGPSGCGGAQALSASLLLDVSYDTPSSSFLEIAHRRARNATAKSYQTEPEAFRTFGAAGIQVIVGVSGVVRDAVEQFKSGAYTASSDANVAGHFGMGAGGGGASGGGPGRGMGGGRGMGMGGGRRKGLGRGMAGGAPGPPASPQAAPGPGPQGDDLASLKAYAESMAEQLAAIRARIADLEAAAQPSPLVALVDEEKCVGCGICAQSCPDAAITVDDVARVDGGKCTGCGRCLPECPEGALSLHART